MHQIIYTFLDAAIAALVLIPVFLLLNRFFFHSGQKTVCYFILAVYLSGMFSVVGLPDIRYIRFNFHVNLIPFAYMFSDFRSSLLNVLLFLPLGFFLSVFWKYFKKGYRTILFGLYTSLLIEFMQIFTLRATDINDLITNTTGTLIGWMIARTLLICFPSISPGWKTKELFLICGTAFTVMFFIHPFLSDLVWACLL